MAGRTSRDFTGDNRSFQSDDGNIFTLNGYTKIIKTCETNSDLYKCLQDKISDDVDADVWLSQLTSRDMFTRVQHLFSYWREYCEADKLTNQKECIRLIQIFSLLENVFRNTLLQPYIPAYRTINMNCGQYRSFVTKVEENLFQELNFEHISPNLLVYQEQNSAQTILNAITCFVFWHHLSIKLKTKF